MKIKKDFVDGYVLAQNGKTLLSPTLNLNGTSFEVLSANYDLVVKCLREASDAMCNIAPNSRDYPDTWEELEAREQNSLRMQPLQCAIAELSRIYLDLVEQNDLRNSMHSHK